MTSKVQLSRPFLDGSPTLLSGGACGAVIGVSLLALKGAGPANFQCGFLAFRACGSQTLASGAGSPEHANKIEVARPAGAAWAAAGISSVSAATLAAVVSRKRRIPARTARRADGAAAVETLPFVDRKTTKKFFRGLQQSDAYTKFSQRQMKNAMTELRDTSGSELLRRVREAGFRLTIGDVTIVLAESYGFCWGVERAVAMAYEARNFFPDRTIWVTNEIIHNPQVNESLAKKEMGFIAKGPDGHKDFSVVKEGDVVILPAFGASVDEMALMQQKNVKIVDTTCPWVSKVWNSVERSKTKGYTSIIHGKYDHEETIATKSFAETYIIVKTMAEAEYLASYILEGGDRAEFMAKFEKAMSSGFDPDKDLECVGVANQTTMLKGETLLIGKLFERVMIRKYGPQEVTKHYIAFNTICDATEDRQSAIYKMFDAEYEPPTSKLYAELEGEQVGIQLTSDKKSELSSKAIEAESKGGVASGAPKEASAAKVDICLIVGGFNSSNTTHLLEIAEEEGVPGYHIDCAERIGGSGPTLENCIEHKPLSTPVAQAMMDEGLEVAESFLPEGPLVVGVSSGASTPDDKVEECLLRILELKGVSLDQ